ncbi:MAG: nucleotide pyrophosphatase, partial [Actinomycetota bacterium]|nr:nucleotide pyrophosphatase [Actinomycetota bacterium]
SASLYDIAPTALYLAGCSIPEMDGHVLTQWLPRALVDATPPKVAALDLPLAGAQTEAPAYSADEEAQIEESLRNLGYL